MESLHQDFSKETNMYNNLMSVEKIKEAVRLNGYYIFKNYLDIELFDSCLIELESSFKSKVVYGTTQGNRQIVRNNSIKWSVGAFQGSQINNSRLMVTFYNPLFCDDIFNFHNNFKKIIELRDFIRDDGVSTFDLNLPPDSFNACRFQYYPSGGGFMSMHKDTTGTETSTYVQYLQLLAPITKRGKHFTEGGAIININNQIIDLEDIINPGDVLLYDANSYHGVKDVDPHLSLNSNIFKGRVVALTTIYN